jgi:UDP-2,3-diacylglucosamine pyrophosphatase LpxH
MAQFTMRSKIVAISDLHLGQSGVDGLGQYSLLSSRVAQNLVRPLVQSVARFADNDPVTLVVAGDFLDLAIAYAEDALADLHVLLGAFVGVVRFEEIVHVVGNHDHHLWSQHSEDKRIFAPLREGRVPSHGDAPRAKAAYQVTPPSGESFGLLQPLVDRIFGSVGPKITIAYPSYVRQIDRDETQLYVTHGHLFGGLYTELSRLLRDKLAGLPLAQVAATVNQPVIESIFWLLGETGEGIGADGLVEAIYTDAQRGTLSQVRGLVARLVDQVLPHGVLWRVLGHWERKIVVDAIMTELAKVVLSPRAASSTSADRFADLETTRAALRGWLRDTIGDRLERRTIVLYGHTHVWDEYEIPDSAICSWNLGTWLVEPDHPRPRTGFLSIEGAHARWVDVPGTL